jgi:streptogramin lyase
MRIEDRVRETVSRHVSDVGQTDDAWSSIERRMGVRERRARIGRIAAACLTLVLFAGVLTGLWLSLRPGTRPVPLVGETMPPLVFDPRVTATIDLSGSGHVSSVLVAEGSVWATVSGTEGEAPELLRIDPATNNVVARIPVSTVPGWEVSGDGIAFGAGAVWLTGRSYQDETAILVRVDPSTERVTANIELDGMDGGDVAVGETGVWVSVFGDDGSVRVVRVDEATNSIRATIPIDGVWVREIFAVGAHVLVRSRDDDSSFLTVIDAATNEVTASRRASMMSGNLEGPFAQWEGLVWAAAESGGALVRIDPATGEERGEPISVSAWITGVTLVPGEGGLWFAGYPQHQADGDPAVYRIDSAGELTMVPVEKSEDTVAMAVGSGAVWVLTYQGTITRIDLYRPA